MANWQLQDSSSSDYAYDYGYDSNEYAESGGDETEYNTDWTAFRAVGVKTARVHDARGGAKTVLAAIAIASPEPWRGGAGGDAVVFYSRANGGRLVANGGLSGAPGVSAEDFARAPDLSDVIAAAAPLLSGCILVAQQPSLVLRLLGLNRGEFSGIVDLGAINPSFKDAIVGHLNWSPSCTPGRWSVSHVAVTALQLAFIHDCPAPNWNADFDTEVLCIAEYARDLMQFFGSEFGWVSFSQLGSARDGCPMPGWLRGRYTYPELFSQHLFYLFELHDGRQFIRRREEETLRPFSLVGHTPTTSTPEPAPPAPPTAPPAPALPATVASSAGEYEAALVGYLSGKGLMSLSIVGQDLPVPRDLAPLGRFIDARSELFRRSGRFVCLVDEEEDYNGQEFDGFVASVHLGMVRAIREMREMRETFTSPPPSPPPAPAVEESDPESPLGPDETDKACAVCLSRRKVGVFVPCMHRCCCMPCGDRLMQTEQQCPICRRAATTFARVYD